MPFSNGPNNINNSDNASSVPGPVEKYSLNLKEELFGRPERRLSKRERRASVRVIKSPMRWPLLFLFVNCVVLISSLALCFSPASFYIAGAYDVSVF